MIHQLLNLTRPLIVVDTETTGIDTKADRIVELAFQVWTPEGLLKEYRTLVNPLVPIRPSSTEVHHIGDVDFVNCRTCGFALAGHPVGASDECTDHSCIEPRGWPTFKQLAPNLAVGFKDCDYAGKNVRFDLRILMSEFARVGVPWSIGNAKIVDIDRLEAWLNKRSLSHLYRKYIGRKLEGAHGALTDVQASTAVIVGQMSSTAQNEDEEGQRLPSDLGELHALQFPGMIDLEGKFQFVDGIPCFTLWGKYAGKPMTAADNGYWDFILKSDFSVEVKALAANAKMGKFPSV